MLSTWKVVTMTTEEKWGTGREVPGDFMETLTLIWEADEEFPGREEGEEVPAAGRTAGFGERPGPAGGLPSPSLCLAISLYVFVGP